MHFHNFLRLVRILDAAFFTQKCEKSLFCIGLSKEQCKNAAKTQWLPLETLYLILRKSVLLVTKLTLLDSPHLMLCRNCLNLTAFNLVRLVLHLNLVRFSLISPPHAYQTHQSRYLTPCWTHQCHLCLSRTWMLSFDRKRILKSSHFSLQMEKTEYFLFINYNTHTLIAVGPNMIQLTFLQ